MSLLFVLSGLIMGSFLCCLSERLLKGKNLLSRSCCDHCHHLLSFRDLIPLFSYLFLRGRCRYCHERLSLRYPCSEMLLAILYLIVYLRCGLSLQTLEYLFLVSLLFMISCCDLLELLIPDLCLWLILLGRIVFLLLRRELTDTLPFLVCGILCVSLPLYLLVLLIRKAADKEAMGLGDILLIGVLGSYLDGMSQLLVLFLASAFGIIHVLFLGKTEQKKPFPFAPSICLSFYLVLLFLKDFVSFF